MADAAYSFVIDGGLTRGHAVRSIFEAVACMLKSNLDYLKADCSEIRSMGGGARSSLWCQIKADLCRRKIVTLKNEETACLGSAILAGTAAGLFDSVESACADKISLNKVYEHYFYIIFYNYISFGQSLQRVVCTFCIDIRFYSFQQFCR